MKSLLVFCLLLVATPALAQKDESRGSRPRPDDEPVDSRLSGPLGPAYAYLKAHGLTSREVNVTVGDPTAEDGFFASIVKLANGGFAISAARDERTEEERNRKDRKGYSVFVTGKSVPLVVVLDAKGEEVWKRELPKKGFLEFEGGALAERKDGSIVAYVPSYVKPSSYPVGRFVALDGRTGKTLWERTLRGSGGLDSPIVGSSRLGEKGAILLDGAIYLAKGETERRYWVGEIGPDGALRSDVTGPYAPRPGDGPVVFDLLHDRTERWLQDEAASGNRTEKPALTYAFTQRVALAGSEWHKPASQGWMIPVIARKDGGFLGVGVRDAREGPRYLALPWKQQTGMPIAIAFAPKGGVAWERTLAADGFDAYGGGLALEAPNGTTIVMVPSYKMRTFGYAARFFALSPSGELLWERTFTAKNGRTPDFERARFSDHGTLLVEGWVYDASFRTMRDWDGELDLSGKIVAEHTGDVRER